MTMFDVERALAKIDDIAGSKITIEGIFHHDGRKGFLKGEEDPIIKVTHPDLLHELYGSVPSYVGGRLLYRDKAYIKGRIDIGQDGTPFLHEIEVMKVYFEDEVIDVIGGTKQAVER